MVVSMAIKSKIGLDFCPIKVSPFSCLAKKIVTDKQIQIFLMIKNNLVTNNLSCLIFQISRLLSWPVLLSVSLPQLLSDLQVGGTESELE